MLRIDRKTKYDEAVREYLAGRKLGEIAREYGITKEALRKNIFRFLRRVGLADRIWERFKDNGLLFCVLDSKERAARVARFILWGIETKEKELDKEGGEKQAKQGKVEKPKILTLYGRKEGQKVYEKLISLSPKKDKEKADEIIEEVKRLKLPIKAKKFVKWIGKLAEEKYDKKGVGYFALFRLSPQANRKGLVVWFHGLTAEDNLKLYLQGGIDKIKKVKEYVGERNLEWIVIKSKLPFKDVNCQCTLSFGIPTFLKNRMLEDVKDKSVSGWLKGILNARLGKLSEKELNKVKELILNRDKIFPEESWEPLAIYVSESERELREKLEKVAKKLGVSPTKFLTYFMIYHYCTENEENRKFCQERFNFDFCS